MERERERSYMTARSMYIRIYINPCMLCIYIDIHEDLNFVINGCLCFDYPTSEARKLLIGF